MSDLAWHNLLWVAYLVAGFIGLRLVVTRILIPLSRRLPEQTPEARQREEDWGNTIVSLVGWLFSLLVFLLVLAALVVFVKKVWTWA